MALQWAFMLNPSPTKKRRSSKAGTRSRSKSKSGARSKSMARARRARPRRRTRRNALYRAKKGSTRKVTTKSGKRRGAGGLWTTTRKGAKKCVTRKSKGKGSFKYPSGRSGVFGWRCAGDDKDNPRRRKRRRKRRVSTRKGQRRKTVSARRAYVGLKRRKKRRSHVAARRRKTSRRRRVTRRRRNPVAARRNPVRRRRVRRRVRRRARRNPGLMGGLRRARKLVTDPKMYIKFAVGAAGMAVGSVAGGVLHRLISKQVPQLGAGMAGTVIKAILEIGSASIIAGFLPAKHQDAFILGAGIGAVKPLTDRAVGPALAMIPGLNGYISDAQMHAIPGIGYPKGVSGYIALDQARRLGLSGQQGLGRGYTWQPGQQHSFTM